MCEAASSVSFRRCSLFFLLLPVIKHFPLRTKTLVLDLRMSSVRQNPVICPSAGPCVPKPDLVSLLEQGREPWMVRTELTRGLCPGECGRAGGGARQVRDPSSQQNSVLTPDRKDAQDFTKPSRSREEMEV